MYKLFLSFLLLMILMQNIIAQKENFGIINYTKPAGYELIENENVLTYYKEDKTTGAFCNFFIYKLMPGQGSVQQDFDFAWTNLVQNPFKFTATPNMQPVAALKGWQLLMGTAMYADNGVNAMVMLSTFSDENNMQAVCILANADIYKKDIEDFIASVDVAQEAGGAVIQTQEEKPTTDNMTSPENGISGTATKSFDAITIPPSWSLNTSGDKLMLEKNTAAGKRVIEFMNLIQSSGDLEKDMAHIFFEVFDGWELRVPGISLFTEADNEKGVTCQGLNYYMLSNSIKKKGPNSFDVIKATVLLIQAGDKVAIINSTDNILGSEVEMALHFLLFNVKLKGVAEKNPVNKGQLIGTWGTSSGLYGNSLNSVTSYTADGKFYVLLQSSYTVGYDYYNDLIKSKQFKNEGGFSLKGNMLERKPASGVTSKYFIRFYARKYGDRAWENFMSLYECNYDKEKISSIVRFQKI